jgi:hypothetical protein
MQRSANVGHCLWKLKIHQIEIMYKVYERGGPSRETQTLLFKVSLSEDWLCSELIMSSIVSIAYRNDGSRDPL